ncbi:hypothetical protein BVRB_027590, partial [Beta vulgaris subsp. vulgaris]
MTKIACTVHAHLLLILRNSEEFPPQFIERFLSSLLFVTTRHSWNLNLLPIPETHIFELLTFCQRKLIATLKCLPKQVLNQTLDHSIATTTQTTPSTHRQWAFVAGPRSIGRYTVESHPESTDIIATVDAQSGELGIEIDVQRAQLTFCNAHLEALQISILLDPDIQLVFGGASPFRLQWSKPH